VLSLVLKGVQHLLEQQGVPFVRTGAARAWVGASKTQFEHKLELERSGCILTLAESRAAPQKTPFSALGPGLVLLGALHPPQLPDVEVLARGTLLRPSYLQRARSFFQGPNAEALIDVMAASALTVAQAG
jgi:hypothetical protein